jgi:hypothetical protein
VPYFHVVYTLPAELRDLAYQSKGLVYGLLMKAAAETTLAIAANPRHLGARLGSPPCCTPGARRRVEDAPPAR